MHGAHGLIQRLKRPWDLQGAQSYCWDYDPAVSMSNCRLSLKTPCLDKQMRTVGADRLLVSSKERKQRTNVFPHVLVTQRIDTWPPAVVALLSGGFRISEAFRPVSTSTVFHFHNGLTIQYSRMQSPSSTSWHDLPQDVLTSVLILAGAWRMPSKIVHETEEEWEVEDEEWASASSVCRAWHNLIMEPSGAALCRLLDGVVGPQRALFKAAQGGGIDRGTSDSATTAATALRSVGLCRIEGGACCLVRRILLGDYYPPGGGGNMEPLPKANCEGAWALAEAAGGGQVEVVKARMDIN